MTLLFLCLSHTLRGLPSMGSHRVGHDWSDLAAAAAAVLFKLAFQVPELAPGCVNRNSVVPCTQSMVKKGACGLLLDPHPGAVGRPARGHLGQVEGKRLALPDVREMLPPTNSLLSRRLWTTHILSVILYLLSRICPSIQRFHQVALESSTPSVSPLTTPTPQIC